MMQPIGDGFPPVEFVRLESPKSPDIHWTSSIVFPTADDGAPMTVSVRKIAHVSVDHAGGQLTFDDDDVPLRSSRGKISLHLIADVLSDANAWIEYDTEVTWQPGEDAQPWEAEQRPDRKARGRLYGRGVSQVLVVYDDEDSE